MLENLQYMYIFQIHDNQIIIQSDQVLKKIIKTFPLQQYRHKVGKNNVHNTTAI